MFKRLYLHVGLFFFVSIAHAATTCQNFPINCAKSGGGGSAYPSSADKASFNPSGIPTRITPWGIEGIWSNRGDKYPASFSIALIKGFQRVGSAITANGDNTFYNYNMVQAHQGTTYQSSAMQSAAEKTVPKIINIGGAVSLLSDSYSIVPVVGASVRYNKLVKQWGSGLGFSLNSKYLDLGWSAFNTPGSTLLNAPSSTTTYLTAGLKLRRLSLEYTNILYTAKGLPAAITEYSRPTNIVTGSLTLGRCIYTAAYRESINILGIRQHLTLLALQVQLSKRLALAYLHNYVPGAHSVGAQIFL